MMNQILPSQANNDVGNILNGVQY